MAMHFDLMDLRVFIAVTEENSFTAGAERAHLSVPSASTRIKNLEQNMGSKLLVRGANGVTVTPAGATFLHHAQRVLEATASLCDSMAQHAAGTRGTVTIAANTTAASEFLPHDVRAFLRAHPSINIALKEQNHDDILRAVIDAKVDIGVVVGMVHSVSLDVYPYRADRLVVAVSIDHPLASRAEVAFDEVLAYDMVGMPESSSIRGFLQREAIKLKRPLQVRIEVGNYAALCRLVEANTGASVLPYSVAVRYADTMSIRLIDLQDTWALREHLLCVRSGVTLPIHTQALLTHLKTQTHTQMYCGLERPYRSEEDSLSN